MNKKMHVKTAVIVMGLIIFAVIGTGLAPATNGADTSYGEHVYEEKNVLRAGNALGELDGEGALMYRNAKIAIELEEVVPYCEKVSIWARRFGLRASTFDVAVSSDGDSWTQIGSATCPSATWTRYDFTDSWVNVRYIRIIKLGTPWTPGGVDATCAEGGSLNGYID
jgi:hypothetical protein